MTDIARLIGEIEKRKLSRQFDHESGSHVYFMALYGHERDALISYIHQLEAALGPFARGASSFSETVPGNMPFFTHNELVLTIDHLRRARLALKPGEAS